MLNYAIGNMPIFILIYRQLDISRLVVFSSVAMHVRPTDLIPRLEHIVVQQVEVREGNRCYYVIVGV